MLYAPHRPVMLAWILATALFSASFASAQTPLVSGSPMDGLLVVGLPDM